MESYRLRRGADGRARVGIRLRGPQLLNHPMYNHSTAFTPEERRALGLDGLLPAVVSTLEEQVRRSYENLARRTDPLEQYVVLTALQDRNEHLFYRLLVDHLEELLPIVYTPTVGRACQHFSRIFRRSRGLWITPEHQGRISEVLTHAPYEDARLVVVTDNEHILGLGDQGAGGMALPLGRIALYVAAAGIHPTQTLAVSLDVGTDNQALLEDELYIGWRKPRLRGAEYDAVVDELVSAVKVRFPRALLQWEDLEPANGWRLLERYRHSLPSFNDDIQGRAVVAVAGLLAAGRVAGRRPAEERVVIAAAGPLGLGMARLLRQILQKAGVEDVSRAVALVDSSGLRIAPAGDDAGELAWPAERARAAGLEPGTSIADVVKALEPTALISVSDTAGALRQNVVRALVSTVERPAIVLLPSPAAPAPVGPEKLRAWTGDKALVIDAATETPDGDEPGEQRGASALAFPGVGLGALVCEAGEVSDGVLAAAAEALARQASEDDLRQGMLPPMVSRLREVSARVAEAVVEQAGREGLARNPPQDAAAAVAAAMWEPAYPVVEVI